jgi:hypothetical protein
MHVVYVRGEFGGFFSSHLFFILHPVSWDMADVCDLLRSLALLATVRCNEISLRKMREKSRV